MLEKLLELLLSAKSGAVATIFLIGTTGALVTATVQNGVTTITVTPTVSASPSASAPASASESASASPTASASTSPSTSSSPSSSSSANCSDAAHTMAAALQEVNGAYAKYHGALERARDKARTGTLRTDLANADNMLKQLRTQADQQIHSLFTCAKGTDDQKDNDNEDEDSDEHGSTSSASPVVSSASPSVSPSVSPSASASTSPSASPLVTATDAKTVADNAVAAMKLVFDTVSAELQTASPASSHRPEKTSGGFEHHDGQGDRD